MKKIIWAICVKEELDNNPGYWVIASDYDSKSEALAETTLQNREEYRETRERYDGEILKSGTYAMGGQLVNGEVYKLVCKEEH